MRASFAQLRLPSYTIDIRCTPEKQLRPAIAPPSSLALHPTPMRAMSLSTFSSPASSPALSPTAAHHCRDLELQKYLLLHEQRESLRQHLDALLTLAPVAPAPTYPSRSLSFSHPHRHHARRRASLPGEDPSALSAAVAAGERELSVVNEGIKRALTELLNCETTRGDRAFRTWVQCRLMDTERELRSGRKRRSAPDA